MMLGDDEAALIARAKTGDQYAFERLLGPAVRPASRLAFAMLRDTALAEDAFQESALRAWRRIGNLRPGARFQPWFLGIVANQCREVRRGRWWQVIRLPEIATTAALDATAAWLEGEDLRQALQTLPFDQRAAILMHFHLDMRLSDVALALDLSVAGVKTRINRALKRLRPTMTAAEAKADG